MCFAIFSAPMYPLYVPHTLEFFREFSWTFVAIIADDEQNFDRI